MEINLLTYLHYSLKWLCPLHRSNGFDQRFRKLKPKPKLNPPNAHRSQIKICENRQTQNVQFRFMPNAFRILKPIQKSFRNTGANAFAKNQMRLAYEDKRDLYCRHLSLNPALPSDSHSEIVNISHVRWIDIFIFLDLEHQIVISE